jgi:hypothetical protein
MRTELRSPSRLSLALLVLLACAGAWLLNETAWIPAGPGSDHGGLSPGSDWDWRVEMSLASQSYAAAGEAPHWNPHPAFGEPLLANPESFVRHPAWRATGERGWRLGLASIQAVHLFVLFLGLGLLGRALGLSGLGAAATGVVLVTSYEWVTRLVSGHLFVLGVCVWPMAVAATLYSLREERRAQSLGWAALAGAALGLASLAGGHYSMPIGLMIVAWILWAEGAGALSLVPALLLFMPLLSPQGPPAGRWVLEAACFAAVVAGLVRGKIHKQQLLTGLGVVGGLLAVAGPTILQSRVALAGGNRLVAWSLQARDRLPAEFTWDNVFHMGQIEGYLHLESPTVWFWAAVGCAGLMVRSWGLGTVVVALLGAAWTSGHAWKPWSFVTALPGSAAMVEHMRFQLPVLVFPALGLLCLAWLGTRRFASERAADAVAVALGFALGGLSFVHPHADQPQDSTPLVSEPLSGVLVRTLIDDQRPLSDAPGAGDVRFRRAILEYEPLAPPAVAGDALAWTIADGAFAPLPGGSRVEARGGDWRVSAPPGTVAVFAQRDLTGWRCNGDQVLDESLLTEDYPRFEDSPDNLPPEGQPIEYRPTEIGSGSRWLVARVPDSGELRCRWVTPGAVAAHGGRLAGILLVAGLFGIARRRP